MNSVMATLHSVLRPNIDTCNIQLGFALQLYSDWLFVIGAKVGGIKKTQVFGQAIFHSSPLRSPRQQ